MELKQVKNLGLIRVVQTLSLSQVITISTPSVPKSHQNHGSKAGESYAETTKGDRSLSIEMTWALLSSALRHRYTYFTIGTKTKLYRTVTVKSTLGSHSIFVNFCNILAYSHVTNNLFWMVEHGAESLLNAIQTEKALDLRLLLKTSHEQPADQREWAFTRLSTPQHLLQTNEGGLTRQVAA